MLTQRADCLVRAGEPGPAAARARLKEGPHGSEVKPRGVLRSGDSGDTPPARRGTHLRLPSSGAAGPRARAHAPRRHADVRAGRRRRCSRRACGWCASSSNAQIEELSYDEFLTGMPEQSVCAVVTLDPLPGKALISFDLPAVLTMVDHQLGGPGGADQPDRPLTDIEQSITKTLLTRMLRELTYAFETDRQGRAAAASPSSPTRGSCRPRSRRTRSSSPGWTSPSVSSRAASSSACRSRCSRRPWRP